MQVYAVVLRDESHKVRQSIHQHFPDDFHQINDDLFLVRTRNTNATDLSRLLGMTPDENEETPQSGIVFRLSAHYYGYWGRALWEWVADAFGADE